MKPLSTVTVIWTYYALIGEVESAAKAGRQMSGNVTYRELSDHG